MVSETVTITVSLTGPKEALVRCKRIWDATMAGKPCRADDVGYVRGCLEVIVEKLGK